MKSPSAILKIALQVVLLVALTGAALATRRHVLNAQRQLAPDGSIAFSLESALAFRRIQMVYRDGDLPQIDRGIQYPGGAPSTRSASNACMRARPRDGPAP